MHEKFILRCLELAKIGNGTVAPNPLVGAVLVHDGKIIGEGWHQQFGGTHAEVNCINSVADENKKWIAESTLYVNLEPCNHHGKTPPCTDLILNNNIKKVIVGCRDINPLVSGRGVQRLMDSGVGVIENILEEDCKNLNRRFFTFQKQHRPYIILKWAQTKNGFIAGENFKQIKISNFETDVLVHQWRSCESAIIVGFNTALYDNPKLTARLFPSQKQPLRIVIDKENKLPATHFLLADEFSTLILNTRKNETIRNKEFLKIDFNENWLPDFLKNLYDRKVLSLIIEGGAKLLQTFIQSSIWDEARIITNTEMKIDEGILSPNLAENFSEEFKIGNNKISFYKH